MQALLIRKGFQDKLPGEKNLTFLSKKEKVDILQKAHCMVILTLSDKLLREVAKEDTTVRVCLKLETLYMTKSLMNRLHKKTKLYTFRMALSMSIDEHLDELIRLSWILLTLIL